MPYIIPESSWVPPFSYQSEGPFLTAAYSALNGIDGYYWFMAQGVGFETNIKKWGVGTPMLMGSWPATALMFRKGYIKQGKPAFEEFRSMQSLWDLEPSKLVESAGFDLNRDASAFNRGGNSSIDPLTYLVGPVLVHYGEKDGVKAPRLDKFIDRKGKKVTSNTGQIVMNYGDGIATINAPQAQGASGFLSKQRQILLDDLTIISNDHYATILAVSVDDRELKDSTKILLQISTRARPHGWRESDGVKYQVKDQRFNGKRIEEVGGAPWNIVKTQGLKIRIGNKRISTATILDANLYPTKETARMTKTTSQWEIAVPDDVLYILLE